MEQPIVDSRYQNGKIYKLVCDATPIVYYGSTIQLLSKRLNIHKYSTNCCSRELFELGNVSIELIEEYPCNNKQELLARERIYIEFMLNNFTHRVICNKEIPNRTPKEYRQDNRESISEKSRKYRQDNRDSITEKQKEYYHDNRESINEQQRKYRQDNREFINEKFNCDCGGKYTRYHKPRHLKTKKHLDYINSLGIE
jgi:hypothetical protein